MAGETTTSKVKNKAQSAAKKGSETTEEQLIYSNLLNICMKIGLVTIVISFFLYVSGIMTPKLDINDVINNWSDAPKAAAKADAGSAKATSAGGTVTAGAEKKAGGSAEKKTAYDKLLEENGIQHGWGWVKLYGYGDFLNMFPIAFLASITILCYIAIIPTFFRKKDTIYATLAIIEVVILLGAASGIIAGGH
jgi:ribosomal protein L12E/L44/L45/RPP1/RPP2